MNKVLVTGANSLLATNIIIELLSQGYYVKGFLRNNNNFKYYKHPNLELIEGDIRDNEALKTALKHCCNVIHVAAVTDQALLRYSEYQSVNISATESLIKLSINENVKTFVYVSSANAFGFGTTNNIENESIGIKAPFTKSLYAQSKHEGQSIALAYKDKINIIIANPTFMIGAYDSKPSSGKILLMGYHKKIIFYPPGGKNFIHVNDAAIGVIKAMEIGKNGEAYILANENLSYKDFFKKLSKITNTHPLYIKVPKFILLLFGIIGSFIRIIGIKTSISYSNMQIVCIKNFFNNYKASKNLNLSYKTTEQAIRDALNWFIKTKMIKKEFD